MAAIYEGALLTIAASKAGNPHEGLFTARADIYLGSILPGFSSMLIRKRLPIPPDLTTTFGDPPDRNEWSLHYRGWCFQELELSPRIIHFGLHEVIWQCSSAQCLESHPTSKLSISRRSAFTEVTAKVRPRLWHSFLERYTSRSLTYPKDRLPAIAAIAKKFQTLNPDRHYIAGLWTDTLLYDLLWHKKGPDTKRHNSNELQIPSWSWASLTGRIVYIMEIPKTLKAIAEVVRTKYTIDGPEFTGHIREASITLSAPVISLDDTISSEEMANKARDFLTKCIEETISPDFSGFRQLLGESPFHLLQHEIKWDTFADQEEYDYRKKFASNLWVVLCMEIPSTYRRFNCLLVKRGVEAGTYVRVGYTCIHLNELRLSPIFCRELKRDKDLERQWKVLTENKNYDSLLFDVIDEARKKYVEDIWYAIKETKRREIILV